MSNEQLHLIAPPPPLTRTDAVEKLKGLVGQDLRPLADKFGITVWKNGNRNKGWAGQVVEKYLGQSPNSEQAADFGDWELKVVPLTLNTAGHLRAKESMAITMFTANEIEEQAFEESHLFDKLNRLLLVARLYCDPAESESPLLGAAAFDLTDPHTYQQIVEDYEEIRWLVRNEGIHAVGGQVGQLIQPRVKGGAGAGRGGHGFYARACFVAKILGI
jgi:DNA mismatch repair protein MutH